MVQFQAVAWHGEDTDTEYMIHIFGRTEDGKSVHIETPFEPYFFVRVGGDRTPQLIVQEYQPYSTATVRRKDLWGFRNQELSTFVKLGFKTLGELRECRPRGLKVYEKNLDPVLRFMHRTEIKSTGWIEVPESASPGYDSTCDIDLCVADWRTLKPVDRDDIAPLRIASLDIEACSESGAFPDAFRSNDVCFQVAVTTRAFGSDEWLDRKCFCVKRTEGPDMEWFETEREMLERLGEYLVKLDPDIVTGWNIFGFDLEYLYNRAVVIAAGSKAQHWGRLRGRSNELVTKRLASNALGDNTLKMVPMLGRYVFDMFQDVKREHKLESYSLNNVSKVFLNDEKIDMPVKEMFRRFRSGEGLNEVAEYCIKDTELPHRIATKLCLIQNLIEMAKATWVPLSYLSERGQQIKVFSQVCRKARELGFMVPTLYSKTTGDEEKYQGATVLDAQTGAYYGPVTALDFASLYPSIMRAHNLCYSTLVIDPKFGNVPGIVYEQYGPYKFAQALRAEDGTMLPVSSLLPAILNELAAFRKKAKKLMAAAEGTPMEAVYNGQQLAYKISMNSIYGFTGATKGMLPCVAIASTVTMRGRQMIEETKNYVEEHFPGAKVRYGDSVMPGTPVLIRYDDYKVERPEIQELGSQWVPYPGFMKQGTDKEMCELVGIDSYTHQGWKPIRRVIRHKCSKKIWRVTSPYGTVDVTEDHSLLDEHMNLLKPNQIRPWTQLLNTGFIGKLDGETKVELLHESWDGYVYDLETDAGTFQAGVGQLIVKNTDSVMVEFDVQGRKGQEAIDYSWEQGEQASEQCSKLFKAPNDLELEKVYCPYFLYSKKRYAAKMYEKKGDSVVFKKIDVKGLQVVRRDTCPYVRGVLKHLLDLVLNSEDPRPAIEYARDSARKLLKGKVDSKDLTMSKQLSAEYKTRVPHLEVRNKIRARAPGSEPQNGDRVAFLVTKGPGLLCDKAEDPSWVAEHKVPIDYVYYFDHQMAKPVCDLLEPLVGANPFQTIFKSVDYLTIPHITSFYQRKGNAH
jgi:DNA polymerase delta subunit 1